MQQAISIGLQEPILHNISASGYSETTKSSLARLFSDSPMETQDSICHLFVISYGSAHSKRTRH